MRRSRSNPVLKKKLSGKPPKRRVVDESGTDLRSISLESFNDENVLLTPPLKDWGAGAMALAFIQGYHPNTQIAYVVDDPAKKQKVQQLASELGLRLFHRHRPMMGAGTIDQFWGGKDGKKFTQPLIGAIQFFVVTEDTHKDENMDWSPLKPGDLVITHMSTRPAWQRSGLNTMMVRAICSEKPHRRLVFEDLTPDGTKFARAFKDEQVYHFGPRVPKERWTVHRIEDKPPDFSA